MSNHYDNEFFFNHYSQMSRSKGGLSAAGEWHQMKTLIPDLTGKKVLDLGCGYGWHCKYAADNGAVQILGIDISKKMLAEAEKRNSAPGIQYRLCGIEEYEYPEKQWDFVISNLALHYIEDIQSVFENVHRTLAVNGEFVFNIEHPTFTAGINQSWITNESGNALYWPVDDYYYPGKRVTDFLGCETIKYHHTVEQILMGLINNGFELSAVLEARPEENSIQSMPDEMRRPMMLLVKSKKK